MKQSHHYALFSARFDPLIGGVESFTSNMAKELATQGNRVTVITKRIDDSPEREQREDGISVIRLPTVSLVNDRLPLSKRNARHRKLLSAAATSGIDRVLVNNRFYPHSIDGLKFAQSLGLPTVMLDHGTAYLTLGNAVIDLVIKSYEHAITAKTKRFNPTYAGISKKSAEWLGQFGITTSLVIPNAIDAEKFREMSSRRDFRSELGLNKEGILITFVGRLTPEKGGETLVRAAKHFEDCGVSFALAGTGTMAEKLASQAGCNVHFLGLINRRDLSALLQTADAFCLPTRSEGFCTSLLESSAWGIPSIMPDVGGVREVMGKPGSGIILESTAEPAVVQGIEEVLALGADGRSKMGEAARLTVEHRFSWPAAVEALERAFELAESDGNV